MSKDYKVQGVSKFREFKPGNMVKVQTSDKREFKGVYAGTVIYNINKLRSEGRGFYVIIYDIEAQKATLVNILEYCQRKQVNIVNVGGTRLVKELSEYLRKYHRDLEQYQELVKQKIEIDKKAELSRVNLEKLAVKGVKMDDTTSKKLKDDLYQQDPFSRVKSIITEDNIGFNVEARGENRLYVYHDYYDVYTTSSDIGVGTYLEYDDTRMLAGKPKPESVAKHLRDSGYVRVSVEDFKRLVKKYAKIVEIKGDFFQAELRDGKGDRLSITVSFEIVFKNPARIKVEHLEQLAQDLKFIYQAITYYSTPKRRGFHW